jgi:hypothetical protein
VYSSEHDWAAWESVQGARRHHRFVEDRILIDSFGAEDRSPIGGHAESVITS